MNNINQTIVKAVLLLASQGTHEALVSTIGLERSLYLAISSLVHKLHLQCGEKGVDSFSLVIVKVLVAHIGDIGLLCYLGSYAVLVAYDLGILFGASYLKFFTKSFFNFTKLLVPYIHMQQQTLAQSPSQAEDELELVMELSEKDILFEKKKTIVKAVLLLASQGTREALVSTQQQTLAQSPSQAEDELELVMELSEKDILFEKKKKLLEVKGFDPKGSVKIKSNCSIESVKSVLEEMLQIARILNSDEVDLYFGRIDASRPVGFCSPRNELDSLQLILSLVDKSNSKDQQMQSKVFQDLRNATLDMIHEFGNNIKEDVKIVPGWNLEKEKCLLQWGENNGVKARLDVAYVEGAGRGVIAKEDLEVGDIALEIPVSVIISEDLIRETSMFPVLEKVEGMYSETMLLLWSMKEKHDTNSKFKTYFDALPEAFNTGLSFGMEAVMALDGTLLLEEIVQAKEHLRSQYDGLVPSLCKEYPDIFPPEVYTWDEFLWACELWYSNSMKIMFNDGKLRTCLIPIAGFLNHSISPHIMHYGRVDSTTNCLKFPLSRPCAAGEQCYLSYGNLSSSHLITFYGFLPNGDNPYDVVPLDIDLSQVDSTEDTCPMSNWSTHMVRGTWLSNDHGIFHYGLPPPLLENLREARASMLQSNINEQEKLEIELEVLEDLHSTFDAMMQNLGETEPLVRCEKLMEQEKLEIELEVLEDLHSTFDAMMQNLGETEPLVRCEKLMMLAYCFQRHITYLHILLNVGRHVSPFSDNIFRVTRHWYKKHLAAIAVYIFEKKHQSLNSNLGIAEHLMSNIQRFMKQGQLFMERNRDH
ncbi:SET domain-containing protein [Artemisia annua]|uniref:SET domain-containing protein n=1 Tax=Artemisia annua TaxID=35608 RepID=A0A2U1QA53_ARTAN|nr:SET domain-containing protein [Artemisia annua]